MNGLKAIIRDLKKQYVVTKKEANVLDKYILSNLYQRIAPYLDLDFESYEEFKTILNEATKTVYTIDGVLLSDREIIELEYKKVKEAYDTKILTNSKDTRYNIENIEYQKLALAEYYFGQLEQFGKLDKYKQKEHIDNIKLVIVRISILLGVENGLYYETFSLFEENLGFKNILDNPNNIIP